MGAQGKTALVKRPKRRWSENKVSVWETGCENGEWLQVASVWLMWDFWSNR